MRIQLSDLDEGRNTFAHDYAPGELLLDDRVAMVTPPVVSGVIEGNGQRLLIGGRVRGSVRLECDRCLQPREYAVDSAFKVRYVTPQEYEAEQAVELSDDDLDFSVFDGESILIDELVAEEMMLALPDHFLCREDCKGICAVCGGDKNVADCNCESEKTDPRWDELKRLVNRK